MSEVAYTGADNLEAMEAATNYNRFLRDSILSAIPAGSTRILDFGAGTGTFAERIRSSGFSVTCLETDSGLSRKLRDMGFEVKSSLNAEDCGRWDCIYSLNVLEHIEDDRAAIDRIASSLRPGGTAFIFVPAHPLLYSAMDRKVGHVRRYSRAHMQRLLTGAGLKVEEIRYADSMGFLVTLAYKLFGNRTGDLDPTAVFLFDRLAFPVSLIVDRVVHPLFGKNLWVRARKP
jgi:SAM-dependent methyltransferase